MLQWVYHVVDQVEAEAAQDPEYRELSTRQANRPQVSSINQKKPPAWRQGAFPHKRIKERGRKSSNETNDS